MLTPASPASCFVLCALDTLFLPTRGDELYVEEHGVLSPFTRTGDAASLAAGLLKSAACSLGRAILT